MNPTDMKNCLDSGKYADRVKNDADTAASLGVSGTPGNILLDTKTGKTKLMPFQPMMKDNNKFIIDICKLIIACFGFAD